MTTRIQSLLLAIAVASFLTLSGCADSQTEQKIAPLPQKDQESQTIGEPESLDKLTGQDVNVSGEIHSEHVDIFHTDFVLSINNISEQ